MIVPIKTGNLATKQARQGSIFSSSKRLQMTDSIDLTVQSLQAHAVEHDHWCIAWSGGNAIIAAAGMPEFDDSGCDGYTDKYGTEVVSQWVQWNIETE